MLEDVIYDMSIMTTWSGIVYVITMPIIFTIAKLKFKVWFDYEKIFKLSFIVALCCYLIFTYTSTWIPFLIARGVEQPGEFLPYIMGEITGFVFGMVIFTELFYAIGRMIHTKETIEYKQKT